MGPVLVTTGHKEPEVSVLRTHCPTDRRKFTCATQGQHIVYY